MGLGWVAQRLPPMQMGNSLSRPHLGSGQVQEGRQPLGRVGGYRAFLLKFVEEAASASAMAIC